MAEKKKLRIGLCSHAFEFVDFDIYFNHLYCVCQWSKEYDLILIGKKGLQAAEARNLIADMAISKECTHMFFMDADHIFPKEALPLLLENSNEAMVSGLVCKKGENFTQVIWNVVGAGKDRKYVSAKLSLDGNIYDVGVCAFGATLINLEKLQKLDKPYFRDTCEATSKGDFNNIRSDINICNAFREQLKEKIWIDTRVLIGHYGVKQPVYPQNAEIHARLDKTVNDSRLLREGQQGFWFEPLC